MNQLTSCGSTVGSFPSAWKFLLHSAHFPDREKLVAWLKTIKISREKENVRMTSKLTRLQTGKISLNELSVATTQLLCVLAKIFSLAKNSRSWKNRSSFSIFLVKGQEVAAENSCWKWRRIYEIRVKRWRKLRVVNVQANQQCPKDKWSVRKINKTSEIDEKTFSVNFPLITKRKAQISFFVKNFPCHGNPVLQ